MVENRAKLRLKIAKKIWFEAYSASVYWFKVIILIKTLEGHHKLLFETIWIDVWSFWGFLVATEWLKIGTNYGSKLQKIQFEAFSSSVYQSKGVFLIKTIEGHCKLSFDTIFINVWSFWGFLVAKEWLQIGPNWG